MQAPQIGNVNLRNSVFEIWVDLCFETFGVKRTLGNRLIQLSLCMIFMMTSSNGNIFRATGHLCGEFTGHRWIPRTKASDAELWCLLWSAPEWGWWFEIPIRSLWRHRNVWYIFGHYSSCVTRNVNLNQMSKFYATIFLEYIQFYNSHSA